MMIDDDHYDDDGHIGIDEDDDLADTLAPSLVLVLVLLVPFVVVAVLLVLLLILTAAVAVTNRTVVMTIKMLCVHLRGSTKVGLRLYEQLRFLASGEDMYYLDPTVGLGGISPEATEPEWPDHNRKDHKVEKKVEVADDMRIYEFGALLERYGVDIDRLGCGEVKSLATFHQEVVQEKASQLFEVNGCLERRVERVIVIVVAKSPEGKAWQMSPYIIQSQPGIWHVGHGLTRRWSPQSIMSLTLEVSLMSGMTVSLQTHGDESVESLRVRAQRALGAGKGRLLDSTGRVLDGGEPLKKARLQYQEPLTFQVRRVEICGGWLDFAAILGNGSVVTWGKAHFGGDSSAAFAAILGDGSVVTWGNADLGGDSSAVRDQLKNVQQIQATMAAFAAVLADGSVVTWGKAHFGGDCSAVHDELRNVQQIQATKHAFAAILADGSVVAWGSGPGGDSSAVQDQLKNVQQIQATSLAFAAILADGSVVAWGSGPGGDSSAVRDQLRNVQQIQATSQAFAAILGDGSVVTWGAGAEFGDLGGDSRRVRDQLKNVRQIQATVWAFAAIRADGSVVTWGNAGHGGDSSAVQDQLKNVQQIQATSLAFAAILADGSVVTWGNAYYGGDSSAVRDRLRNVQQIQATLHAFAAVLADGSVVTWGDAEYGGDSSAVLDQLKNVQQIQATRHAFAAILGDGSVVTWGNAYCGDAADLAIRNATDVHRDTRTNHAQQGIEVTIPDGCAWKETLRVEMSDRFGLPRDIQEELLPIEANWFREERKVARSLPLMQTTYRIHKVRIRVANPERAELRGLGLPTMCTFAANDRSHWAWVSAEAGVQSTNNEVLTKLLQDNNIKLDEWPHGSFADLLTEVYETQASTLRVIKGELIRHLRVIKVWLVTEILGVTHLLVTKSKDRPLCMSLERGMTWEQALDQALSIRLGLEDNFKKKSIIVDETSKQFFQEIEYSLSYPGLKTAYHIHEVTCRVADPHTLLGLPEGNDFVISHGSADDSVTPTHYTWQPFQAQARLIGRRKKCLKMTLMDKNSATVEELNLPAPKRQLPLPEPMVFAVNDEPNSRLKELMRGRETNWERAWNAATHICDPEYSLQDFYEDDGCTDTTQPGTRHCIWLLIRSGVSIMSLTFEVSLVSGKTASLQAHGDDSVESLMVRAQRALGVGRGRLMDSAGSILDGAAPLKTARYKEPVTLQIRRVDICCGKQAFAAILGDGSVVSWGGNSSAVQDQLKNVQQIQATKQAFAAILGDGSVVTWGNAGYSGDSSAVRDQLKNVQQIQATPDAFAAILGDGSVVTWGHAHFGGDSTAVRDQLKNVQQIQATKHAFVAILGDESVVTWGHAHFGGDSIAVQDHLKNVQQIQATQRAFAAILGDGSVVTWGNAGYGGDSSAVQDQLKNVQQIQATDFAFAAILGDGSVVTWSNAGYGGDSSAVQDQLKNVQQVQATQTAFAAILGDGSVVTWGHVCFGGDSSAVQDELKNVQQIQATDFAFAAILGDGSVVTWGHARFGGDSIPVQDHLKNVQQIQATQCAFAAILGDGSVVTWGNAVYGGDSSAVQDELKNVQQLQATDFAFAAIREDGSVVIWGTDGYGDNSSVLCKVI
eukprot:s577_g3.t2